MISLQMFNMGLKWQKEITADKGKQLTKSHHFRNYAEPHSAVNLALELKPLPPAAGYSIMHWQVTLRIKEIKNSCHGPERAFNCSFIIVFMSR